MNEVFDLEAHRAERDRRLERENEMLRAERERLERILTLCLEVAVGKTTVSPLALLEVLCAAIGSDPSRPAWVEARERSRREAQDAMVLRVLRETAA